MERHATIPQYEVDPDRAAKQRLELQNADLQVQVRALKAQITRTAAEGIFGSGARRRGNAVGVQHSVCDAKPDERIATQTGTEAALASSQRMFKVAQEALERANHNSDELEVHRMSAIETMKNVVDLTQLSLDRGKRLTFKQKSADFETALQEVNAKGRAFLRAAKRIAQPEAQGPRQYVDLFNPAPRSAPNATAPAQTALQSHSQHGTAQTVKAASKLGSKPAHGSKPASNPSAGQQSAPQLPTRPAPKPASGSKATDTPSTSRPPVPGAPAKVDHPPSSKVHNTPRAQGPPKPQASQGSKPTPSPNVESGSKSNPRPVTVPRTPATKAERFPPLATGRRPDLPLTRPDELTMPDISKVKSKGTPFDLAEYRRSVQKQVAEGTLPPVPKERDPEVEAFHRLLESSQTHRHPEPEWKGEGISFFDFVEAEDVEDQGVEVGYSMENLYDVSDDEDPEPQKAGIPVAIETTKGPHAEAESKGRVRAESKPTPTLPENKAPQVNTEPLTPTQSGPEVPKDTPTKLTTPEKPDVTQEEPKPSQSEHGKPEDDSTRPTIQEKAPEKMSSVVSNPPTKPKFQTTKRQLQNAVAGKDKQTPAKTKGSNENIPTTKGSVPPTPVPAGRAGKPFRSGLSTTGFRLNREWDNFMGKEAEENKRAAEQAEANKRAGIVPPTLQLPAMKETWKQVKVDKSSNERGIVGVLRGVNHMGRDQAPAAKARPETEAEANDTTAPATSIAETYLSSANAFQLEDGSARTSAEDWLTIEPFESISGITAPPESSLLFSTTDVVPSYYATFDDESDEEGLSIPPQPAARPSTNVSTEEQFDLGFKDNLNEGEPASWADETQNEVESQDATDVAFTGQTGLTAQDEEKQKEWDKHTAQTVDTEGDRRRAEKNRKKKEKSKAKNKLRKEEAEAEAASNTLKNAG